MSILTQSAGCTTSEPNDASDPFAGYGAAEVHSALDRILADLDPDAESGAERMALQQTLEKQLDRLAAALPPGLRFTVKPERDAWQREDGGRYFRDEFSAVILNPAGPSWVGIADDAAGAVDAALEKYHASMEAASAEHDRMAETDA